MAWPGQNELTVEMLWNLVRPHKPFCTISANEEVILNQRYKKCLKFVISTVSVDSLALLGDGPSATTVLTKFFSCMYKGPAVWSG